MRLKALSLAAIALFLTSPSSASSQCEQYLQVAIASLAGGQCPPVPMTAALSDACARGSSSLVSRLKALGKPRGLTLLAVWQSPIGIVEEYSVEFERGRLSWQISIDDRGEVVVLWPSS